MRNHLNGNRWIVPLLAVALMAPVLPTASADQAADSPTIGDEEPGLEQEAFEDRIVVGYDQADGLDRSRVAQIAEENGGQLLRDDERIGFLVVEVPDDGQDAFAEAVDQVPGVRYVQPDTAVETAFVPDDPRYDDQWGPPAVGMETAWNQGLGSHDVSVAVIDTGVDYTHEDLAENVCTLGKDYANDDADPMDDHGHGTHVAGTVAARIDNGAGVAGMANACIHAIKALDEDGRGSSADVASAIVDAADAGTEVVTLSLGTSPGLDTDGPRADAVAYAYEKGALLVAAAGNNGCDPVGFPAAYPEVVAVGSLDEPGDTRSSFSNCGHELEVAAPGGDIVSTVPGDGYAVKSGTSMATPHVTGLAALVLDQAPDLTNVELRCMLRGTADDLGPDGRDVEYGFGRVDADELIDLPSPDPSCVDRLEPPFEPPCPIPCVEDLDDGRAQHFRTTSLWHASDTCDTAPDGSAYLGFTRETSCTYDWGDRARGFADLDVDLSEVTTANVSFEHRIVEDPSDDAEGLFLTYSTDGGSTWYVLDDFSATTEQDWTRESYDVDFLVDEEVTFRWWFDTFNGVDNDQLGWLLDDIVVDGNQLPNASFAFEPTAPTTADTIGFEDTSRDPDGSIVDWSWSLGDGTTTSEQHPSHSYEDDGTYTVCLTVTDDDGAQDTTCQGLEVANVAPTPSFAVSPQPATSAETVSFEDTSTDPDGSIVAHDWSFGDGETSTRESPSHQYIDGGTYEACLTVTDDDGAEASTCRDVEVIPVVMHGRAVAVDGGLPVGEINRADTGEVRSEGEEQTSQRAVPVTFGPTSASGARSTVATEIGQAVATAELDQVTLELAGDRLTLSGLEAEAVATCDRRQGWTTVGAVHVNGEDLGLPAQQLPPDTAVPLPGGGELVLNEQTVTSDGLHVTGAKLVHEAVGELRLAQALAGLSPCPSDVR